MKKLIIIASVFYLFLILSSTSSALSLPIQINGKIVNAHNTPIGSVEITAFSGGKKIAKTTSTDSGFYEMRIDNLPALPSSIKLSFYKASYKKQSISIDKFYNEGNLYSAFKNTSLVRTAGPAFWIALAILIIMYVLITFEIFHRTLAATIGAVLALFLSYTLGALNPNYFIISFDEAMKAIDLNVIFLLMGMMIIVGIMKKTGVFQWLTYISYKMSKGKVFRLAAILMIVTAITSAFLDNVTTMLLLTPVSIEIALVLKINPFSLLIPEVMASNAGGTATLIGDPPNILIGSYAHLTFNQFLINLTPVIVIITIATILIMKLVYGKEYKKAAIGNVDELLAKLKREYKITDMKLLKKSLWVLGFVVLLFITHGALHMEPSIAALLGATILLVISGADVVEILEKEVEWPTLIFFMMLFIVVGAAEQTGIIQLLADMVKQLAGTSRVAAIILIIWVSAFASAIIDNIPFTATMLPVVAYLAETIPGANGAILWWALSLGACLGGNGTLIGASANVVTAGLAEKAGYPLRFIEFFKVGMPVMIVSIIIATVWLLIGG
ncbi:MAG: citrate transporter [bacterium]|nr:MAG: citrate transporter [bacterium]